MNENQERKELTGKKRRNIWSLPSKLLGIALWAAFIIVCIINREKISTEGIVGLVPKDSWISALLLFCLFAVKSVSVVVYSGILYAASGILFSLPVAIVVNTIGTIIMTTIPFYIGKKAGSKMIDSILKKNKKLELLRDTQNKNEFLVSFFLRMVGFLPADLVAMYLGASGMRYKPYFFGTVIGLMPAIVCFSIMGMSIDDVGSPQFIISAAVEIGLMLLSVLLYVIWRRVNKKKQKSEEGNKGANK